MKNDTRMVTTAIIWVAFTIIMGIIAAALAITQPNMDTVSTGALLAIIIGLMVTVADSTKAIWGFKPDQEDESEEARRAKAKRLEKSRVERLIADLDDDEIYDLEALLLARDQENASRQHGGER